MTTIMSATSYDDENKKNQRTLTVNVSGSSNKKAKIDNNYNEEPQPPQRQPKPEEEEDDKGLVDEYTLDEKEEDGDEGAVPLPSLPSRSASVTVANDEDDDDNADDDEDNDDDNDGIVDSCTIANSCNIMLFGLSCTVQLHSLQQILEKFGSVLSCKLVKLKLGASKHNNQYAYVQYSNQQQARNAYMALDGAKLFSQEQPIMVVVPPSAPASGKWTL